MGDNIHKTHFQVPEMPWKRKENEMPMYDYEERENYDEFKPEDKPKLGTPRRHREKEKQAIKLLQKIINIICVDEFDNSYDFYYKLVFLMNGNSDLVDWVMKYKGE